ITMLYPQAAEKAFLLREFDETLEDYEKDITDPIGGSYEVYVFCRDQIEQGIASLLKFIEQTSGRPLVDRPAKKTMTIALGADHAGYALKGIFKEYLQKNGLAVSDFGSSCSEAADYPDFGQSVGRSVAEHRAQ